MKKLFLLLFLLFPQLAFSQSGPIQICYTSDGRNCIPLQVASYSKPISISTATTTEIVALVTGKWIYVSSFDIVAGGTGTIKFISGTGTACAGSPADLTGAYPLVANNVLTKGNGVGVVLFVPPSRALCIVTSAGVQMSGSISYAQY